jgi:hypothetical protein
MEIVCFSTLKDYTDHWEKLGGRYSDSYGSAVGQLILLIIDEYDAISMPLQVMQKDPMILTIWMRHNSLYSKVKFNSSLDNGVETEEYDLEAIQNEEKMKQNKKLLTITFTKGSRSITIAVPDSNWTVGDLSAELFRVIGIDVNNYMLELEDNRTITYKS